MLQRRINADDLPGRPEAEMLQRTTDSSPPAGYRYIGMDRFILPDDGLASAQERRHPATQLRGSPPRHCDLVGLETSAIQPDRRDLYNQNSSDINDLKTSLDNGQLAIRRNLHY